MKKTKNNIENVMQKIEEIENNLINNSEEVFCPSCGCKRAAAAFTECPDCGAEMWPIYQKK